jgi:non-heme chloroperoxidase
MPPAQIFESFHKVKERVLDIESHAGVIAMGTLTTKDGTAIFYKSWGAGPTVVFSHAWALSADEWDPQMLFLVQEGYRVIAHDRRGHGRSGQPSNGFNMDTFADDLAEVIEALGVKQATLVGHSMGGGEVVRYLARHGTSHVSKAMLISSVPPLMLKGPDNPTSTGKEVFDHYRLGVSLNRSQAYLDTATAFYGYDRPGVSISEGLRDKFWQQAIMGSAKAHYDSVKAFSETDFTEDLRNIRIPMLFMHGDADLLVPMADTTVRAAKLVKNSRVIVYPGYPHGLTELHPEQINNDLLTFLRS